MIDMQLNFYSGFSAVIWSSIFISVLYLFRRTMPKTNFLGFSSLIALYLYGVLLYFSHLNCRIQRLLTAILCACTQHSGIGCFTKNSLFRWELSRFLSPVFCCSGIFTNIFVCHEVFASMQRPGMSAQTNNSKKSKRKASEKCV